MATNNNIKSEARRRKIQDAGSDRLALITGRIQTLPASPRTPSQSTTHLHARNESTPAVFFSQQDHETPRTPFYDHSSAGFHDAASTYKVLKRERSLGYLKGNSYDVGSKFEAQLHKIKTDREALRAIIKDDIKPEPLPDKSVVQDTSDEKKPLLEPNKPNQNKIFSSKRIHYCVIYSQGTRSICALVIALLVVLSYSEYPLLNIVSSESMISSRPLYILLLTNITIVVALVYLENRREMEEAEAEKTQYQEERHNMADAIVLMERGLVTYQIVRGVFIDFSIYAVVVICGLSLV